MRIIDSLRQEHMPYMVFTLCRFVGSKKMKSDELMKYLTLNDSAENKKSRQNFNKVFSFAKDCGFVSEDLEGYIVTTFTKKELDSYRKFRYKVFEEVTYDLNTNFTGITKWLLSQDKSIFNMGVDEFMANIPQKFTPSKDYTRGYFFWAEALGLINIYKSTNRKIYFAVQEILVDWLKFNKPFRKGEQVLCQVFINKLIDDCPIFNESFSSNRINFALSCALRIMHESGYIKLIYVKDSGDIWNLHESNAYQENNKITEIKVV